MNILSCYLNNSKEFISIFEDNLQIFSFLFIGNTDSNVLK